MRKTLIVVDVQNDFVTGSLGSQEAVAIIPNVKKKIMEYTSRGDEVIFTRDTHFDNYLETGEGKKLPIVHCQNGTYGWQVVDEIDNPSCEHIDKPTFGWTLWNVRKDDDGVCSVRCFDEIEIIGLCTDICVVSNALILRAMFPDINISVDQACCAGVTPESHKAAIETMRACQINIL